MTSILVLLLYVAGIAILAFVLYTVIRLAVRKAMREHQEWLDTRPTRSSPALVE
ncbi:hypothetical protein BJ978_000539 [Agromyces terreus]|uniref:Uncharacterized protein n=1 Tax=Agromyces terreus TaxID=424795 RepID=A0A9X2KA12_9MICO|nr:hypothetical protein [Agromyces terreus]MCP2369863.1 hypothetical protein [Agromyces terreus]